MTKLLALGTIALAACASSPATTGKSTQPTHPMTATKAPGDGLRIELTKIYVDDQDKALRFYTEVLGFEKKEDVSNGPYRWLTVVSPGEPDGTELQLALDDNPAAKAYQEAMFEQRQPAAMFFTDDVEAAYARMKAKGAAFPMPPTDVTMAKIATVDDTCGNLIQITELY